MRYVQGWVNALLLIKAIERAENLTGPGLKAALESMRNEDLGGLVPPVTFLPGDHRPSMTVRLATVKDGKIVTLGWAELPRRSDWLGW